MPEPSDIEQRKFDLEEQKFQHAKHIDQQKLRSDRIAKIWTQCSIFVPLLIFLTGFFLNTFSEQRKRDQTRTEDTNRQKRQFIEKQLSQFYYPIQLRLNKDNAFFTTSADQLKAGNIKVGLRIRNEYIVPNHEEILKIIDEHFDLIKNDAEEDRAIHPLMDAIKAYERHVAIFKALKETGDARMPFQLKEQFPKEFFKIIDDRIADLENQRDGLLP